ncbi:MAG: efflux RND transporter periplasmic adaptor subunit [Bacteroidales bacterium]|nr:efflux RND transporter periplasmic adaptor subunit [Bacteroidales bacterium]MDP3003614.1 efflux RND transporter periplasmic adaptor subunit [Bacteroidales bacterium]
MKKRTLIIIAIVVVAVSAILVIKPFAKKEAAVTFDTVKVEKGNITNTVTATGTIEAITTVNVGTQVSGIIQHIYVDFNENVKQGQLLAKLDETSLRAQLEQSQASVDQAQAQVNFQKATYNRLKALYVKKLIAQADYDQAVFNYENSKASLSNAKSALARTKVTLEYATITSPIDGVVLNRAIEEGQTVAASFNTPILFTIVNDLTQMEVQTSVDEADIGKVKQGQRVEFTVDAYPDMKFEGDVSEVRLQPVTINNVVTYVVILSAPNPDKKLMPGLTASATIYVEEKENTLVLSGKAIRFTPDAAFLKKMMARMQSGAAGRNSSQAAMPGQMNPGQVPEAGMMPHGMPPVGLLPGGDKAAPGSKTVWVKDEKGGIHPVPVIIGIDNGSNVEILSGLKEGDVVVISMSDVTVKTTTTKQNDGLRGPFPF